MQVHVAVGKQEINEYPVTALQIMVIINNARMLGLVP